MKNKSLHNAEWWLRSPYYDYPGNTCVITYDGGSDNCSMVDHTTIGVVPALRIML